MAPSAPLTGSTTADSRAFESTYAYAAWRFTQALGRLS